MCIGRVSMCAGASVREGSFAERALPLVREAPAQISDFRFRCDEGTDRASDAAP